MKKLVLLFLVGSFMAASAFAAPKEDVRCYSSLVAGGYGYLVRIGENKTDQHIAFLSKYVPGGEVQYLEDYGVNETPAGAPGAPVVYSTPSMNFSLSVCATCSPVDGHSPGTLSAIYDGGTIASVPVLCTMGQ